MTRSQLNMITRLARAGALERAWALFHAGGGDLAGSQDPDVLTVHGRLLKDRAAQEQGAARETSLNDAITAYLRASELSRATYPLINAATLACLAGRRDQSQRLAQETIALLDGGQYAPETDYWLNATRAEALLLLDRISEADAALGTAIRCQPEAWEDHASTLRQFSLILRETGGAETWLAPYRPPPCLHFEGILGIAADDAAAQAAIEDQVRAIAPSYAIGALAAGADILVAEAAVRAGGLVHVVLPCPPELFCELSIAPFGAAWQSRFDLLMDQAASVLILDDWHPLSGASVAVAREAAMGQAIKEGRRLQSSALALRVRSLDEAPPPFDDDALKQVGIPLREVTVERSSNVQSALSADMRPMALLAVPPGAGAKLEPEALGSGRRLSGRRLGKQQDHLIFGFDALADCAEVACSFARRHPDVRLGIDYRAVPLANRHDLRADRAAAIALADLGGAIGLSESAALALAVHLPSAHVQTMGDIHTAAGDVAIYGLFLDTASGDKIGQ
ncbi:TRAFs-binding domain-containing protein [Sphingobium aquiterrae]|uniref:TRAFs-binding domain-containing protein n=1 Tax=Sphingobium aquiterrae TaxID=2038656 RepID=UPI003017232E